METLIHGDCLETLKTLPENSVDSIVTDPPYELGFMGKSWDNTGIANNKEMWGEVMRVLKPGGHLLAFSGTRTYHRMAVAIEDAGFEVRDMITWAYGQGFPKSLNVFKQLQKKCECGNMGVYENRTKQVGENGEKESEYFMRFMQEANLSQTKPIEKEQGEVLQSQLRGSALQGTLQNNEQWEESKKSSQGREERILEGGNNNEKTKGELQGSDLPEMPTGVSSDGEERRLHNATQVGDGSTLEPTIIESGGSASHRSQSEQQQYKQPCAFCKQWGTQATRTLGIGSALKPAHEPICMARKPLAEKTVAENVLKYGTGVINIDESRVGTVDNRARKNYTEPGFSGGWGAKDTENNSLGRFPANLIHDNSEEVRECFPNESERFFKSIIYTAKASKSERNKGCEGLEEKEGIRTNAPRENEDVKTPTRTNNHPTVKPIALMEYLIKMVTPKGGTVLDPFMGSGSTGVAAKQNGYDFIGIDMTPEYVEIAKARINSVPVTLL